MILEAENREKKVNPSMKDLEFTLKKMRSYGPVSFCSITGDDGSYLQVAGGQFTCTVEFYSALKKKHFRAYSDHSSTKFSDDTKLVFGGGEIPLKMDEWLDIKRALKEFVCFYEKGGVSESLSWREIKLNTSD